MIIFGLAVGTLNWLWIPATFKSYVARAIQQRGTQMKPDREKLFEEVRRQVKIINKWIDGVEQE